MKIRSSLRRAAAILVTLAAPALGQTPPMTPDVPARFDAALAGYDYVKREVMMPMRDGVKLYTVIVVPKTAARAPIILTRTPYNAAGRTTRASSSRMLGTLPQGDEVFVKDGYIRVFQDVRGKYRSEGDYVMTRPLKGPLNQTAVDHSTDAYDTIDWLVKNVPESNGKVGMLGSSYEGFTVVMALVRPHPALKVAAPMSPMVDGWMGDDWFHYGAFRQTNFDYFTGQTAARGDGTGIVRRGYDDYENFRQAGSAGDFAKAAGLDQLPFWRKVAEHPAYDAFWQEQALDKTMAAQPLAVPTMWIQGLWDQEDMWGAIHSYAAVEPKDTGNDKNFLVMGPWRHSGVNYDGTSLGPLKFEGDTALQFRRDVLKPFFDQFLKDGAAKADTPPVFIYNTGENHWDRFKAWPLACADGCGQKSKPLYLTAGSGLSFTPPGGRAADPAGFDEYVSDPAKPVAYLPQADQLRRRRALADVAPRRPAIRRRSPRCAVLRHAGPDRAGAHRGRAEGEPRGVDQRHRQRLGGQADRRLSGRSAGPSRDGRLSAERVDGHLPRPLSRELLGAEGALAQHAADVCVRAAGREPRVPAGAPDHGAGAIDLVPALRPQSADVRAEYLLRESGGLRQGDAADLSRGRRRELHRPAGRAGALTPLLVQRRVRRRRAGSVGASTSRAIMTSVDLMIASASSPRRSLSSLTASLVMTAVSS